LFLKLANAEADALAYSALAFYATRSITLENHRDGSIGSIAQEQSSQYRQGSIIRYVIHDNIGRGHLISRKKNHDNIDSLVNWEHTLVYMCMQYPASINNSRQVFCTLPHFGHVHQCMAGAI
jgi:hypothetical protein